MKHVTELAEFSYSMQGVMGVKDSAWISGIAISDTDDVATNKALLDEVGKTIATVHLNNPARHSRITVDVRGPARTPFKFTDRIDKVGVVTLDDLAEHYGVER